MPRAQRGALLDSACKGDAELRRLVESLLEEHERLNEIPSSSYHSYGSPAAETLPVHFCGAEKRLGRYLLVEWLGAGGMGVVYRARDEKLERDVAIKVLSAGLLVNDEARRHFKREALALAKLNHPHIAAVYDAGEEDGIDYIVMELVDGESLAVKLRRGRMDAKEATAIALQVAEALEEAHEHGVIHRDLKPANIMVTPKGRTKVLDFGLAKLFTQGDAGVSMTEARGVMGTPMYMSPEQALGKRVDARTDIWSLGAVYYESLAGRPPFEATSGLAIMRAIVDAPLVPLCTVRPDAPAEAEQIAARALEKDADRRYQTAAEFAQESRDLVARLSGSVAPFLITKRSKLPTVAAMVLFAVVIASAGTWMYRRATERRWARMEAIPEFQRLMDVRRPLAALQVLKRAEKDLPGDGDLKRFSDENTESIAINSDPQGAHVEVQDYLDPKSEWISLGTTPLANVRLPRGYFRWKVSKQGFEPNIAAPETNDSMSFSLAAQQKAPPGMVFVPAQTWGSYVGFIGSVGPYKIPSYFVDRFEVTNKDYQKFVDSGGYDKPEYWPADFERDGRKLSRSDVMAQFRDSSGRSGPSTWAGGHFAEGQGDYPVTGVSWFEASAYAKFAGKSLPTMSQWYEDAPTDDAEYTAPLSNFSGSSAAAVGTYQGVGPFGTYDMFGNAREWVANMVEGDLRLILGGFWMSPNYMSGSPEALSPYDRSVGNGFRCVVNSETLPKEVTDPIHRVSRDFSKFKPASDAVFRAYGALYAYPKTPLHAESEGIVHETADWREEKVSFDAAYNGERMSAYLFLPKRAKPPYQTILFFPSARVQFLPPNSNELGDIQFFDYILQSGRAVMYPVYQETYERRIKDFSPGASQEVLLTTEWYKDASRSLDYLDTRSDIDHGKMGYLGVSMGSADGVIITAMLRERLKTAIFLDGGYFLEKPPPGGDQADFAPRIKIPVLMVNGRYDFTFPLDKAQNPLFEMLGTPPHQKSHVVLDTPHDVTEQRTVLVKTTLDWLDRYLGRVE